MRILFLILVALLLGCSPSSRTGPRSVSESSVARPRLQDRIAFVEQYITFRRTYVDLEYDIEYQNNGTGLVPGPSDWDIKILAVIPADEIDEWIPAGAKKTDKTPPPWLNAMAGNIQTANVTEWYTRGKSVVIGVDRNASIIAYRNTTNPN